MSTRCQIGFYRKENTNLQKPDALLYRHCDGYPGKEDGSEYGILTDLVPFLRAFNEDRGLGDWEYASAWTMWHLARNYVEDRNGCSFEMPTHYEKPRFLGLGISKSFHGEIEFYYAIKHDRLEVYKVGGAFDEKQTFTLTETISLAPIEAVS